MGELVKFQLDNNLNFVNIFLPSNCNWKTLQDLIQVRFNLTNDDKIYEVIIMDSTTKKGIGCIKQNDNRVTVPLNSYCLVKLASNGNQLPISPINKNPQTPRKSPSESFFQAKSIEPSPIVVTESPEPIAIAKVSTLAVSEFEEDEEDVGNSLFHDACINGHLQYVRTLIQGGQDLDVTNAKRQTPFMLACLHGHLDIARLLAQSGANLFAEDETWSSAIHYAARNGNLTLIQWLIDTNHDRSITNRLNQTPLDIAKLYQNKDAVDFFLECANQPLEPNSGDKASDPTGDPAEIESSSPPRPVDSLSLSETLFLQACAQGDRDLIVTYLENNGDIHCKNENGSQGIHFLASYGDVSLMRLLLKSDIDIDVLNNNHCTALHFACQNSHLEMIQYLVTECNSNVFIENSNGMTPIHILCGTSEGYDALVWFIQSHPLYFNEFIQQNQLSPYPHIKSLLSSNITLLHVACTSSNSKILSCLLDHGFDLSLRDEKSHNVLHIACNEDNLEAVKLICSRASDIRQLINVAVDESNITPIFYACLSGSYEIVKYLNKFDPDFSIRNVRGNTCIHAACQSGNLKLVKYLLKKGCSIYVVNNSGFWPLDFAIKTGSKELIDFLRSLNAINSTLYHELAHLCLSNDIYGLKQWMQEGYHLIPAVNILAYENNATFEEPVFVSILHEVCLRGIINVYDLISKSPNFTLDIYDDFNRTPLHFLCMSTSPNAFQILESMIAFDVFLDPVDSLGYTPFFYACQYGNIIVAQKLINLGCNIYHKGGRRDSLTTALHLSAAYGHLDLVQWLTQSGLNIDALNENENTPLDVSKFEGHHDIYQWLLTVGSTTNANRLETTLLPQIVWALTHNYFQFATSALKEIITLVDDYQSFESDIDGSNLLHYACGCGDIDTAAYIISKSCNICATNFEGYTPLHIACMKGHKPILEYLRDTCGLQITMKDKIGNSGFHYACIYNHLHIVKYYCQHGLINMVNNDCLHGLHYACQYGHLDIVLLLIEYNVNINCLNNENLTPLHVACYYQWDDIIVALIKTRKCDLEIEDHNHLTVPHLISLIGYKPLITWIEKVLSGAEVYPIYESPQYLKHRGKRLRLTDEAISETESEDNHSKSDSVERSGLPSIFSPNSLFFCVSDAAQNASVISTATRREHKISIPRDVEKSEHSFDEVVPVNRSSRAHSSTSNELSHHADTARATKEQVSEIHRNLLESIDNHNFDLFCELFESNHDTLNLSYVNPLTMNNIFHMVAKNNELRVLKFIIENIPHFNSILSCVNSKNVNSVTPLHIACEEQFTDLAIYMVCHCGADLNIPDSYSQTPFTILITRKNGAALKEIDRYLSQQNHDVLNLSHLSKTEQTYFHLAINTKSLDIIEIVFSFFQQYSSLEIDDIVNSLDCEGKSALHYACQFCSYNVVTFLISNSADISLTDNQNRPPVYYAIIAGNLKIVQLLIEKYNNIHCINDTGESLLHAACQFGKLAIAKWLVSRGLDMHRKNNHGLTPIQCAEQSNNQGIIEWAETFS